jgi:hypothetical protein
MRSTVAWGKVNRHHPIAVIDPARGPNHRNQVRAGSVAHLRENLAAERVTLDEEALRELDGVGR